MSLSLSLALVILATLVWIVLLVTRGRPFKLELLDVFVLLALAFYFK